MKIAFLFRIKINTNCFVLIMNWINWNFRGGKDCNLYKIYSMR